MPKLLWNYKSAECSVQGMKKKPMLSKDISQCAKGKEESYYQICSFTFPTAISKHCKILSFHGK
jgi:hypothetical protein